MAYIPTSWGRTRRPKTLANRDNAVSSKETAAAVSVCTASGDLRDDLDSIAYPKVNGYATENQRYLHVYVEGAGTNSVDIYGYNYAFGKWAPLLEHDGEGSRIIMNAAIVSSGNPGQYKFHIAGVDRIAFVKSTTDAPTSAYAACSNF